MSPGDVVLIALPQVGSAASKLRPALLLVGLPGPYQNLLLCGVSTQLQHPTGRKSSSPLVRDGIELVPNLTHIVGRNQTLYFYYEVYDPGVENGAPQLRTNLTFYRGQIKVLETPTVARASVDAADRHAAVFQFEVPASSFKAGLYTCQVNIIDEVSGKFAFPRLQMFVR